MRGVDTLSHIEVRIDGVDDNILSVIDSVWTIRMGNSGADKVCNAIPDVSSVGLLLWPFLFFWNVVCQ